MNASWLLNRHGTQALRKIPSNKVRKCDAFRGLDKVIKDYLNTVPLIAALSHRSLRPRHWSRVMERTKKTFTSPLDDREMKLQAILELSLFGFSADVEEICDQVGHRSRCVGRLNLVVAQAMKEEKMEQGLRELGEQWAIASWVSEPYKEGSEVRSLFSLSHGDACECTGMCVSAR